MQGRRLPVDAYLGKRLLGKGGNEISDLFGVTSENEPVDRLYCEMYHQMVSLKMISFDE